MEIKPTFESYFDIVDRKRGGLKRERPTKIIIDTDPGGDDAQAIILAYHLAKKYKTEILGITTIAGNGTLDDVVLNAQITLNSCKAAEIPIYRGAEQYLNPYEYDHLHYGPDGFGGFQAEMREKVTLDNVQKQTAVDFLIETITKYPNEITLICLAPLTNIALAIQKDPTFVKKVKDVIILGGTYLSHGNTKYSCSEFNFLKDPEAANIVFAECDKITMVPIEVSRSFRLVDQDYVRQAFTARTERGIVVNRSFEIAYLNSENYYEVVDPCAVIVAFCPELVTEYYEKPCYIETQGKYTRAMVVINWVGRGIEDRHDTTIVAALDFKAVVDILIESVTD